MPTIRWRPAVLGAVFAVASYYILVIGVLVPLADVLVAADPGVVTVVVVSLQVGLLLITGASVASLTRRGWGLDARREALPTVLAAGLLGWAVVSVLTVVATAAQAVPFPVGALLVTLLLWTAVPLAGGALVRPGAPARPSNRYVARLDREAGETGEVAAEYAGAIIIAVLLIGSLLLTVSPGGAVSSHLKYVICQALTFGQGSCEAPSATAGEDPHKPTDACVLVNTADDREVGLEVMFLAGGNGGLIRVEEMSDGTFRVSEELSAGVGATEGLGLGGTFTVGDHSYGVEASADMTGLAEFAGGRTWVVDDEGSKDALVGYLQDERNYQTIENLSSGTPVLAPIVQGGTALWDYFTDDGYAPPAPTETFFQTGVSGNAGATGSAGGLVADGGVDYAQALGYRQNHETGATTMYFTQTISGDGSVALDNVISAGELSGSGSIEVLMAVTVDSDGNPLRLEVQGQAVGEAKAQVSSLFGGAYGPDPNGGHLYSASLELTGAETRDIAMDLMHATGILPADKNIVAQAGHAYDALSTAVGAAQERGIVTRQDLTTESTTPFAIQGGGTVGPIGLGGSFENSTTTTTSTGAQYLSDGLWKDWQECA